MEDMETKRSELRRMAQINKKNIIKFKEPVNKQSELGRGDGTNKQKLKN